MPLSGDAKPSRPLLPYSGEGTTQQEAGTGIAALAARRAAAGPAVNAAGWPARYEIRVEGVLDSRWATWFGGLQVVSEGEETVISGLLADQPALHGLLAKVRDLGLCLISARRLDIGQGGDGAPS
jgi:hypothetical protein